MTPILKAQSVYQRERCARTFWEDLHLYLRKGVVISTEHQFIMGRAVSSGWDARDIIDPMSVALGMRDCWHVALYSGDIKEALDFMPYYLPFVSFERRNKLKIYATVTITNRILGHDTIKV